MSDTRIQYTGNGSTTLWAVPFPFLDRSHVEYLEDGVVITSGVSWITDGILQKTPAAANGVTVLIKRTTSTESDYVSWQNASSQNEETLNAARLQVLYRLQEILEDPDYSSTSAAQAAATAAAASASAAQDDAEYCYYQTIDAQAAATAAAASAASINLPDPATHTTEMVRANSGGTALEYRTAAQVRTDLSLGALATMATVGTAQIDSNAVTPAKFETKKLVNSYVVLSNQQTAGTNGGGSTSGSFQTLTLNTKVDPDNISALSSNDFSLPAGTYYISGWQSFYNGSSNANSQLNLYNVTDAADVSGVVGEASWAAGAGNTQIKAFLEGRFTLAGTKTLRIQYRVGASQATNGLGVAANFGKTECFGSFKIIKES